MTQHKKFSTEKFEPENEEASNDGQPWLHIKITRRSLKSKLTHTTRGMEQPAQWPGPIRKTSP